MIDLVVLDVNETLFPLDPIASRMAEVGLEGQLELWFTRILRDGIAAAAAQRFAGFRELAGHHLHDLLAAQDPEARAAGEKGPERSANGRLARVTPSVRQGPAGHERRATLVWVSVLVAGGGRS